MAINSITVKGSIYDINLLKLRPRSPGCFKKGNQPWNKGVSVKLKAGQLDNYHKDIVRMRKSGSTYVDIAKKYNVSPVAVCAVCHKYLPKKKVTKYLGRTIAEWSRILDRDWTTIADHLKRHGHLQNVTNWKEKYNK